MTPSHEEESNYRTAPSVEGFCRHCPHLPAASPPTTPLLRRCASQAQGLSHAVPSARNTLPSRQLVFRTVFSTLRLVPSLGLQLRPRFVPRPWPLKGSYPIQVGPDPQQTSACPSGEGRLPGRQTTLTRPALCCYLKPRSPPAFIFIFFPHRKKIK